MATINMRDVDDQFHRRAKMEAAKAGMSLKDWTIRAMARAMGYSPRATGRALRPSNGKLAEAEGLR
jgi:hypothetical protein